MAYPFGIKKLVISHSSLTTYENCNQKFALYKLLQHGTRGESLPAEVGKAMHVGFQHWLVNEDRTDAIFNMMMAYPVSLNDNPSNHRSLEACFAALNSLMDSYEIGSYDIAEIKGLDGIVRPAVEVPFRIKIKNFSLSDEEEIPVEYIGWMDAVMFDNMQGNYFVPDLKTHRDNMIDLTPKYLLDQQCLPYNMTVDHILGKTLDELEIRYFACYLDIEKPRTQIYKFKKTKDDVRDWARGLLFDLYQIKWQYENGWFRRARSGNACSSWRRSCEFLNWCKNDYDEIQRALLEDKEPTPDPNENFEPWIEFELDLQLAA